MLFALIIKEFKQIFRNKFLPKLIFIFPFIALILLPFAANFDVENLNLVVVDNDKSSMSKELIGKLKTNSTLSLSSTKESYEDALHEIESMRADMLILIEKGFEKDFLLEKKSEVLIAVNSVNGTTGSMGGMYAINVIMDFAKEKAGQIIAKDAKSSLQIKPLYLFNKSLNYKLYMVPALMVMILTIICGFLPALNIVGEKENGNLEQINVTPISKQVFIFSKLIPYWIIGFVVINIGFIVARFFYGIENHGSFLTIYLFAFIFIFGISGFGLCLSNFAKNYQQAMFMMFFFIMVIVLMSGLYTPFKSMPTWAQVIGSLSPLKHFMEVMRAVYLKGSTIGNLLPELYSLIIISLSFVTLAIITYRKKN